MTHALSTTRLTSWVGVCALGLVMWIAVSAGALAQSPPSAEARLKELSITLPSVPAEQDHRAARHRAGPPVMARKFNRKPVR
jgi:hypothetical protein